MMASRPIELPGASGGGWLRTLTGPGGERGETQSQRCGEEERDGSQFETVGERNSNERLESNEMV